LITVLTAPIRSASGWMRSSSGMMSILCGRVRLQPRALGVVRRKSTSALQRLGLGLDRQAAVVAGDAVLLQPVAVQRRRARMLDRPADDRRERPPRASASRAS
jgi:hypothetical protein